MKICEICGSDDIRNGVCRECGWVVEDHEIVSNTERNYKDEPRLARSVVKFNTPDLEVYNYHSKKTGNRELKRVFGREKYYTKYSYFYEGYVEIKRMFDQLRLPQHILVEATKIWRELLAENFFAEHHIKQGIFAALLKLACGIWDIPLTFEEVAEFSNYDIVTVKRSYLELRKYKKFCFNRTNIQNYINKYSGDFSLTYKEKKEGQKMAQLIENNCDTAGKNPLGYVAAILNILGKKRKDVGEKMPVSLPTITKRKREIIKMMEND